MIRYIDPVFLLTIRVLLDTLHDGLFTRELSGNLYELIKKAVIVSTYSLVIEF